MNRQKLKAAILEKQSFLCVGLDPDPKRLPECVQHFEDPIYEFNKAIIEATKPYCVAYKPNLAFYEAQAVTGWTCLDRTLKLIGDDFFTIADAKRGDIGNTSRLYAQAFFESMNFDAVTVAPYMGVDSVQPFLEFPGKWIILLALTSNKGAADFQFQMLQNQERLYETVLKTSQHWGSPENMMYVVGATQAKELKHIRSIIPDHFLLVPGVGAQGGELEEVAINGFNEDCGLLVNSSRGILYASDGPDFAEAAAAEAARLQSQMALLLKELKVS